MRNSTNMIEYKEEVDGCLNPPTTRNSIVGALRQLPAAWRRTIQLQLCPVLLGQLSQPFDQLDRGRGVAMPAFGSRRRAPAVSRCPGTPQAAALTRRDRRVTPPGSQFVQGRERTNRARPDGPGRHHPNSDN